MVFANNQAPKASGTGSYAAYQAKQRLRAGRAVSTYKHKDLHEQTQAVVLAESAHLGRKMDAVGQNVVEQVKASIGQAMRPFPSQIELASIMSGASTEVSVLSSLLASEGTESKGTSTLPPD